jgi:hypothetical protein
MNDKKYISDVHSYLVFANIDKRNGNIDGHMIILSKEQYEAIGDIVTNGSEFKVLEDATYTLEDG